MKTIYVLLFLLTSTLISCNKENIEKQYPNYITPVNLAKGATNPVLNNDNYVIKDSTEWNNFLTMISEGINVNYYFSQLNIDFSQDMVIAIIDVAYPTGGWTVDITSIIETSNNIEVTFTHLNTGNDTMVSEQPFHIVKIPKSNKPINFIQN